VAVNWPNILLYLSRYLEKAFQGSFPMAVNMLLRCGMQLFYFYVGIIYLSVQIVHSPLLCIQ
jgi:hypothetical protein